jgi:hypothetical protein
MLEAPGAPVRPEEKAGRADQARISFRHSKKIDTDTDADADAKK